MASPLENIRVIDWTQWQQGPVAGLMLGDLGAEVIKIEEYKRGDPGRGVKRTNDGKHRDLPLGRVSYFEISNRNKKSVAINLKKKKGQEIIHQLVEKSDVLLHNFRRETAQKLGLDYQTLSKINPRLIYALASGYGSKGPDRNKPAPGTPGAIRTGIRPISPRRPIPTSGRCTTTSATTRLRTTSC